MSKTILSQKIRRVGEGLYQVASQTVEGRTYCVDLKENRCQCPQWLHRIQGKSTQDCKHLTAARARCAEVTAAKARTIPDVTIDELAAKWETRRPEIAAVLYDEIRRRGAEAVRNEQMLVVFA